MLSGQQREALAATGCEVAFDNLTRQLYATDASLYQIEPAAVAFPRGAHDASAIIRTATNAGLSIIPRGAGTGLVGGALGNGLIVEFARHNQAISHLNVEKRTVRVGPGVVLDALNTFLKPHGFCFGPDVATSSRATLGGMIANNSSGAHVPVYGTTADHVVSLDLVLADGRVETVGPPHEALRPQRELITQLVREHAREIQERMPARLLKRWPGYALDRCLGEPANLNHLLAGSEGTLAAIVSAEVRILPLPRQKGLGLIFFASVSDAMQATVALLDLKPAAIEHIDRVLFDQTKGQLAFRAARDLMQLDDHPCEAILLVEFYDEVEERLASLAQRRLGLRTTILTSPAEMGLVWSLRKAGLSLLTGCKGNAKPITGIEDTAVRPEQLPAYVDGLQSIFKPLGLAACFYGHAATGLLHVRPVLDLHRAADVKKLRLVASEISALVREFKGSLAAEHGVGIARTEFLRAHLGDELLGVMRKIKDAFDPRNAFNPGKIFDDGRFRIDRQLRMDTDRELKLPFAPVLAFAAKDGSFVANLEQCNGCGGCRKAAPTMCPTFVATGDEIMSTRGRANVIRAVLERRGESRTDLLQSEELEAALSHCLSCKACTTECPSNVNMALLKAELLHARQQRHGLTWRERVLSHVDLLGRLGCLVPQFANDLIEERWLRRALSKTLGLAEKRPLPRFAAERFDRWFVQHQPKHRTTRGRVILWDDTFVRYHEPHIGRAAVAVLEAAGFEVALLSGRKCCGRPAFSQGTLDEAKMLGGHNLALLSQENASEPIIFLEPSCWSMFVEDYRELKLPGAEEIARRSFLFEQFLDELLSRESNVLQFRPRPTDAAIHVHCHAKALINSGFMARLIQRIPEHQASLLDSGCCGMAGAFGALESKYELSLKVAAPLVQSLGQQSAGTVVVASGTSCRHQIEHLTPLRPRHMAEVLAEALVR